MSSTPLPMEDKISLQGLAEVAERQIAQWFDVCDSFFEWQKKHLINAEPSSEMVQEHKKTLKLLLRVTRLLHLEVSDPDFPNRSLAEDFAWRLARLEDSWAMLHGEMTTAESEAILQRVFPE